MPHKPKLILTEHNLVKGREQFCVASNKLSHADRNRLERDGWDFRKGTDSNSGRVYANFHGGNPHSKVTELIEHPKRCMIGKTQLTKPDIAALRKAGFQIADQPGKRCYYITPRDQEPGGRYDEIHVRDSVHTEIEL